MAPAFIKQHLMNCYKYDHLQKLKNLNCFRALKHVCVNSGSDTERVEGFHLVFLHFPPSDAPHEAEHIYLKVPLKQPFVCISTGIFVKSGIWN